MPQLADILLTLGPYRLSQVIAKTTQEMPGEAVSHAALVVAESPLPLIIESVPPRVRVKTYIDAILTARHSVLLSPRLVSADQRIVIVKKALEFEGALYGYDRYIGAAMDTILGSDWCARHLYLSKSFPYCSVLVSASYEAQGLDFGEPAQGVVPNEILAFAVRHPELYTIIEIA